MWFRRFFTRERVPLKKESGGDTHPNDSKKSRFERPGARLFLFGYFIVLLGISLYIIVNYWVPTGETRQIENMTMQYDKSAVAKAKIAIPPRGTVNLTNITTEKSTLENSTTVTEKVKYFLGYKNGTEYLISENQTFQPKGNQSYLDKFFHLQSTNMEVRLVSISALFGLLGACISGIMSVLTRKIWATGKFGTAWRLVYVYLARPWVGMAVALVTYISLRAGLINMGTAADVRIISDFGIAGISALVGLVSDEMIVRLRDVFRTFFGITTLQGTDELVVTFPKRNIIKGEKIPISAILAEVRSSQDLSAYFFVDDITIAKFEQKEEKFNDSGIATVNIEGLEVGRTTVSVMVRNGLDLSVSREITVKLPPSNDGGKDGQQGQLVAEGEKQQQTDKIEGKPANLGDKGTTDQGTPTTHMTEPDDKDNSGGKANIE
jgi:hypothetical protein